MGAIIWGLHQVHDGGVQGRRSADEQFYDSDFGGAMYVDGDDGLELPEISRAEHQEARALAREIFSHVP
ncbi:hypothetical protein [Variovorax sp. dw_954]|uniref:hypothetical protein n=1 Tax=Variovorax sp. dw_954 TaxID=2720078 RepID=UPI001BD37FD8|nr:hypothetical protein [Variovorax sp. dw_954]